MKYNWQLLFLAGAIFSCVARVSAQPRERISLDADWLFQKGDPAGMTNQLDYPSVREWILPTGNAFKSGTPAARPEGNLAGDVVFTQPDFDDSGWRKLNLPHDWGIEGPFNLNYPGETAKLPWSGVAWYRKHFEISASDAGRQIYLDVDGAMSRALVWCNGQFVGGWPYGYASWRVDLTPFIKTGGKNVLAIRLDNPPESSRWYPGGGIYRNIWLVKTAPVHVAHWGTHLTTPEAGKKSATIKLSVDVENNSGAESDVNVTTEFFALNAGGKKSANAVALTKTAGIKIAPHSTATADFSATISKPKLWDLKNPNRYAAVTTVVQDGKILDSYETPFGIRTIQFTATNGFLLNGKRVPINGVCDHADLGALGTAINVRALQRQLEILKSMGCNAIRTSHNPPAPELLDLADRMGFLVMDESFDCWMAQKKPHDYHELFPDWHEQDQRALVRRDRNHPCVILWSIGNEISEQVKPSAFHIAEELAADVHMEDDTRLVTAACNHTEAGYNGFQKIVGAFGYNYKPFEYGKFREANPEIPLFGSETASCISSRGEYFFPVSDDKSRGEVNFQVSSYDLCAPRWATTPDDEFRGEDKNPFVAGEFVWTGFDYLGEPTPFGGDSDTMLDFTDPTLRATAEKELQETGKILVPSRSSYFGIVDLAGFKKDRFYLYQAHWRPDFPMAHILPHWNWPDRIGKITPVHVYTSGDEAELFLNGKSLGRKKKGPFEYRLRWDNVKYEPGVLKVVAYKNGKKWATDVVRTTGPAAKILMKPDRALIAADGKDLSYVTVTIADKKNLMVPRADNRVHFEISGPGEIVATDNGDPTSLESFQSKDRNAFNGLALVIVRSTGKSGAIHLTARADGLAPATVTISAKK